MQLGAERDTAISVRHDGRIGWLSLTGRNPSQDRDTELTLDNGQGVGTSLEALRSRPNHSIVIPIQLMLFLRISFQW